MSDSETYASDSEEQSADGAVDQTTPSIEMNADYGDAADPPDVDVPEGEES